MLRLGWLVRCGVASALAVGVMGGHLLGQAKMAVAGPQLVWMDTDIGDDIDDAFALGLVLRSPEVRLIGISTAFGETDTRARLVDRFLRATGATGIPVYAGVATKTDNPLTQRAYAERAAKRVHGDGVAALLEAIRAHPGQLTLLAIGPLFNLGAAIDRDPATFHKLKRVVLMGGAVDRGYGHSASGAPAAPEPEWNIKQDPKGAAKLFAAGVPILMAPLDSTQVPMEAAEREALFAAGTPLTDQITLLYHQWMAHSWNHAPTPTLYDPVAAAYVFRPDLCPMTPMRIVVDANGLTRKVEGASNAEVCLKSDEAGFLKLLEERLVR